VRPIPSDCVGELTKRCLVGRWQTPTFDETRKDGVTEIRASNAVAVYTQGLGAAPFAYEEGNPEPRQRGPRDNITTFPLLERPTVTLRSVK